jgi:hypothetical protein
MAFSCGARSAFKLKERSYLRKMLSRRQLQGFVGRRPERNYDFAWTAAFLLGHLVKNQSRDLIVAKATKTSPINPVQRIPEIPAYPPDAYNENGQPK